jgi:hypothetical protein
LVALIWSAAPCIQGNVPLTKQIMMETAEEKIDAQCTPFVDHPNDVWGWGILDAQAAVQTAMGYCGGSGWLDGFVTDASTTLPIENVLVDARNAGGFGRNDLTDVSGYYTMTLLNGVYTVTASAIGYEEATVTGVGIVTDTITTLDFSLISQGTLFGFVTDADNGSPLVGATVTADDGTTTTTDGNGYYEMFLDEGTYVVTATLQDYAPASASVDIVSGESTQQDFILQANVAFLPSPLEATVLFGSSYSMTASLVNRLSTPYDFEFIEIPVGRGVEAVWPGPDGYGYQGEVVDYNWVDISTTGTPVPGLTDDSYAGPFNVGFSFPLYSTSYTQFYVSSNGFVSFGSGSSDLSNQCPLPNASTPNNILPLMWDDLYPNYSGGGVFYQNYDVCPVGAGACTVVEYWNWNHYAGGVAGTFEAVMYENGSVLMQFLDSGSENGSFSTTGIEGANAPADYGLTYACEMANSLHDSLAMCYTAPGTAGCFGGDVPWLAEVPVSGTVPADSTLDITVLFTATTEMSVTQPGTYYANLLVAGDPRLVVPVIMTVVGEEQPITGLAATNDSPTPLGDTTTLTATVETGTNVQYEWDFGDGSVGTGAEVGHVYPAVGDYVASVLAYNTVSSETTTTTVTITDVPIEGLAAVNDSPTLLGGTTTFTATITAGSNVDYTWDFGDGITMTGQVVGHVYEATGTYTATVTATNSLGSVSVETVAIVYTIEPLTYYIYLPIIYKQ